MGSSLITIYTHVLVDPADKSKSILDPVILSSGICSLYKPRPTSEVLACQFIKNFLSNNMIKIPQNRNHSRHPSKSRKIIIIISITIIVRYILSFSKKIHTLSRTCAPFLQEYTPTRASKILFNLVALGHVNWKCTCPTDVFICPTIFHLIQNYHFFLNLL